MSSLLCVAVLLISISGLEFLPVDDKDIDVLAFDEIDNSIDGGDGDIDLSSLGPNAYGSPDNNSGDAVAMWSESSLMNPEEMGNYGQGDILIPTPKTRNGMSDKSSRWPNGIIPYVISGSYNQDQKDMIMRAIADYHRLTCLRFVPFKGQSDYITFTSGNTGCWSSVGRIGGRQEVNLQIPGCLSKKGTVLHEILHAVGFTHEQSRHERDEYVTVNYNNVKPGAENNFKKSDSKSTSGYGVPYDYNSVMHYSEYAFSKNAQKTIEPKKSPKVDVYIEVMLKGPPELGLGSDEGCKDSGIRAAYAQLLIISAAHDDHLKTIGGVKLGQREGLSRGDVRKVNAMYNCKKQEPQTGWLSEVWQNIFGKEN